MERSLAMQLLIPVASILIMKLVAMLIGYRIVKLGYDALLKGIKGEFDFGGKVTDKMEIKLLSASPGLFFVLFGSAIIVWALTVEKPIKYGVEVPSGPAPQTSVQPETSEASK